MRLDKFLQVARIVKRRALAQELCEDGAVSVNGHIAKAGRALNVGDTVTIRMRHQVLHTTVTELPTGNVPKARATTLYRVDRVEEVEETW
ncbi:MAG: S4 domain-containing protein [Nitrospirota bacterium]|jgi:ribosomal 50S subunit-recycling heat shock protein